MFIPCYVIFFLCLYWCSTYSRGRCYCSLCSLFCGDIGHFTELPNLTDSFPLRCFLTHNFFLFIFRLW